MRLKPEQLARLVDEPPTPEENTSLKASEGLRRELEAMRAQTRALGDLPALQPPAGDWEELEQKLRAAALIDTPVAARRRTGFRWLRYAAALALFAGGATSGWMMAPMAGDTAFDDSAAAVPVIQASSFASIEDARAAVERAEEQWMQAYSDYRRLIDARGGAPGTHDPATRLAGLEALLAASQVVLSEAPADPFFNGFLVNAMLEREQTLREIGRDNWH